MKTVRDACVLQPNALSVKLSEQIEQIDEIIVSESDGSDFFAKTHITYGMQTLITESIARLAGQSSQAVFHLKQAMGGGKTHSLIALGYLAKHPALRKTYGSGIPHASAFGSAKIAAFNGRNSPDHYFWGEVANQLGKEEMFRPFWSGGPKAPDERDWLELFDDEAPTLILLDELPPYFHYLNTQRIGNGTVADIATRAFSNMLTAALRKKNVCIVVSDLAATYDAGTRLINDALQDARAELGRQERSITPVDLAANEIYDILRKRLFESLPDRAVIEDIAATYGRKLEEAVRSKTADRGAEAIADEIVATYPFHPQLKHVIALFKENEDFKQTRGLIELFSRLLRSVWERDANDVFLIGPQHFDLSIPEVREKLSEISRMGDVIAKDLWDSNRSAHAQIQDVTRGNDSASQVGSLILTASLSTAVNAVRGLTRQEMVECLITPLREPTEFLDAFDGLASTAWYLHRTPEGRFYFDRQENLTKMLQSLAATAPDNQVDGLINKRLEEMFHPTRRTVYDRVLPLPTVDEASDSLRRGRSLLVIDPDSKIPPEAVQQLFEGIGQKNNFCILTGDKTSMGSIRKAAQELYAAQQAERRIPPGHPQREELDEKRDMYEHMFSSAILGLFDKVIFPIQRGGRPQLVSKGLEMSRNQSEPFNGEEQIEKTLSSHPIKLYLDVNDNFDAIRIKAEDLLWPENQDEVRWADVADRYAEQPGMPWLPPRGLEELKSMASSRGIWEDLGNGYVTKKPPKKKTTVQIIRETEPDDQGRVRLRINPQNAGPTPRIFYAEEGLITDDSVELREETLTTSALWVTFLVQDPTGQYETGDPETFDNELVIRNSLSERDGERKVELFVAPRGTISYTLDGSEPRNGTTYDEPILIGDEGARIWVFAEADGLEARREFSFPPVGRQGAVIDDIKPAKITARTPRTLDSRAKTFEGLKQAEDMSVTFENVVVTVGGGNRVISVSVGEIGVEAPFIRAILESASEKLAPDAPVSMRFRKANFVSGHDLKRFTESLNIQVAPEDVEQ